MAIAMSHAWRQSYFVVLAGIACSGIWGCLTPPQLDKPLPTSATHSSRAELVHRRPENAVLVAQSASPNKDRSEKPDHPIPQQARSEQSDIRVVAANESDGNDDVQTAEVNPQDNRPRTLPLDPPDMQPAEIRPSPHNVDLATYSGRLPLPDHETRADWAAPYASLPKEWIEKREWKITLPDAVRQSLHGNKGIAVSAYVPPITLAAIDAADSVFDPSLAFGGGWGRTETQVANIVEGNGPTTTAVQDDLFRAPQGLNDQFGLSQQLRSGGTAQVSLGTAYRLTHPGGSFVLLNPSWQSALNMSFIQPLFRGGGRRVNELPIEIARTNYRLSEHDFQAAVSGLIRDVYTAYWGLYSSTEVFKTRRKSLAQAKTTWEKQLERLELGESSLPDVALAREQYESFRAETAKSLQLLADAERALRQLMGLEPDDEWRLVPVSTPESMPVDSDWELAFHNAMTRRPELRSQRTSVETANLELEQSENGMLADVTAYADYQMSGLADRLSRSMHTVFDSQYTSWSFGVRYQRPIGNRAARAALSSTSYRVAQQRAQLRDLEYQVQLELHRAYQGLNTAYEIIEMQENRLQAAKYQLDARQEMFELEEASLDILLRSQAAYAESETDLKVALAQYNQAIADWDFARGLILEKNGIAVSDEMVDP